MSNALRKEASMALNEAATKGVLWQTTKDLILSSKNQATIQRDLNTFREGLYPSNKHTATRLSQDKIIDMLGNEEKRKFLKIKERFDNTEDRTIYLRLLHIILANSKSQSKYNLNELFENILKEDNEEDIYKLIDEALHKFMPESNSKLQLGYSVHNRKIYSEPSNAVRGHHDRDVYMRPNTSHKNKKENEVYENMNKNNSNYNNAGTSNNAGNYETVNKLNSSKKTKKSTEYKPKLPPKVSELIPRYQKFRTIALIFNKNTGHTYYRPINKDEYIKIYKDSEEDKDKLVFLNEDELTSISFIQITSLRQSVVGGRKTLKTRKTNKRRK